MVRLLTTFFQELVMSLIDHDHSSVEDFLDLAIELEKLATKSYQQFSESTRDAEMKKILTNISEVCAKHADMLQKIVLLVNEEGKKKTILIQLPAPGYWEPIKTNASTDALRLLYESSKKHLQIEETMLFNYGQLKHVFVSKEALDLVSELVSDETTHMHLMAQIVLDYEKKNK